MLSHAYLWLTLLKMSGRDVADLELLASPGGGGLQLRLRPGRTAYHDHWDDTSAGVGFNEGQDINLEVVCYAADGVSFCCGVQEAVRVGRVR